MERPFTWYELLPPELRLLVPEHIFFSSVVMVALVALAFFAGRALRRHGDPVIPDERLSLRNVLELVVDFVVALSDSIIGKKGRRYVSLFGSFFVFILASNLSGLIPGFAPPTANWNITLGLAVVSFAAYNVFGFAEHGIGYTRHFLGPMTELPSTRRKVFALLLVPVLILSVLFFFVLEGFSHVFRMLSLSLRLFGNIFGDHMVIEEFIRLTKVAVPVLFYALGAMVSIIQAFVFTVLSVIYVALAISHEH